MAGSKLALEFERRGARSVLAARRHDGRWSAKAALSTEGDEVCHGIVGSSAAGIVGGDELEISARVRCQRAHVLTRPARRNGIVRRVRGPRQQNCIYAGAGACLEWLPQETIVFNGALAELLRKSSWNPTPVLSAGRLLVWAAPVQAKVCRGENAGCAADRARREPLGWSGRSLDGGGGALFRGSVGWAAGRGTFVAGLSMEDRLFGLCREAQPMVGSGAVTAMPGLFVGRYLGSSSEAAKKYFTQLWTILRPGLTGRPAAEPRIWRT